MRCVCVGSVLLVACCVPARLRGQHPPRVSLLSCAALPPTQRPYKVFGVWYYPIPSSQGFVEQGYASWYGPGFHGKKTSNGESYDMHALTAAHKTLPLGTLVKVTRTDTGKSVVVRLNDRGPFVAGRIIDLSNSAAHAIDMVGSGTAPVTIEALQRATEQQRMAGASGRPEPIPDFNSGNFTIPVGILCQQHGRQCHAGSSRAAGAPRARHAGRHPAGCALSCVCRNIS